MTTIYLNPNFKEGSEYGTQLLEDNLDLYLKLVRISIDNYDKELKIPIEYFGTPFSEGVKLQSKKHDSRSGFYLDDLPTSSVSLFGSKLLAAIEEEFKTANVEFGVYTEITKFDHSAQSDLYYHYGYTGAYIVVVFTYKYEFKVIDFQVTQVW